MNEHEEQVAQATQDFLTALPDRMKNGHLGSVICTMFEAFGLPHESRVDICEGVLNVMLEHDLRQDERAAQAADEFLARAAAKARK